jgi:hypothetical protein
VGDYAEVSYVVEGAHGTGYSTGKGRAGPVARPGEDFQAGVSTAKVCHRAKYHIVLISKTAALVLAAPHIAEDVTLREQ